MTKHVLVAILIFIFFTLQARVVAQELRTQHQHGSDAAPPDQSGTQAEHDGMDAMAGMQHGAHQEPVSFVDEILHHSTAGTSAQPNSTPEPMIMLAKGNWLFMFHGEAFINLIEQAARAAMTSFSPPTGLCPWRRDASAVLRSRCAP